VMAKMKLLYEDNDVIVVVKPIGMPSQKDLTKDPDLYSQVVLHVESKRPNTAVGLLQRLDRPVGGIMVLSKSPRAHKNLTAAMIDHQIDKVYLAVVDGVAKDKDTLENYIQKVRGNRAIVSEKKGTNGKKAVLHYRKLDDCLVEGQPYSLLEVQLETGRHHQIRSQLAFHQLPIVGDTKYNKRFMNEKGWFSIGLYAYRLQFLHPVTKKKMIFTEMIASQPFDLFQLDNSK
jgi:23S rRNA pseudouridine1911/1915/1917 synthase